MPQVARKRGRPKDEVRRQRILATAREMFLEHGFQVVSVDAIAAAAEVSNRTVYSHFPSKDELLWAIIRAEGEAIRPHFPSDMPKTLKQYRLGLSQFGIGLVSLLTSPSIIRLGNLMLSEANRHPTLAQAFYSWGPGKTRATLEQWIDHGKTRKWLAAATPRHAGDHLLALWQGTWHLPQQLGLESKLTQPRIKAHVQECLELFFKAYRSH